MPSLTKIFNLINSKKKVFYFKPQYISNTKYLIFSVTKRLLVYFDFLTDKAIFFTIPNKLKMNYKNTKKF